MPYVAWITKKKGPKNEWQINNDKDKEIITKTERDKEIIAKKKKKDMKKIKRQ